MLRVAQAIDQLKFILYLIHGNDLLVGPLHSVFDLPGVYLVGPSELGVYCTSLNSIFVAVRRDPVEGCKK